MFTNNRTPLFVYCYCTRNWLSLILCSSWCVNVDWSRCTQFCRQCLYTRSTLISELHVLYSSPTIFLAIKSRCMRWAGHVVHTGERWVTYRVWWRDLERQFGKLWRNEWKTLCRILKKPVERAWAGLIWLRTVTSGEPFWTGQWTFGLHKTRKIAWLAEELSASRGHRCIDLVM